MLGPDALDAEEDLYAVRLPRVHEYTELAGLNRITREPRRPRRAILASGMAYAATLRALNDLGFTTRDQEHLGLRLVKIDLPWPLSLFVLRAMVRGVDEVLVVEDKAPVVEEQLKAALYRQEEQPRIVGKEDGDGRSLIPRHGAATSRLVAHALARVWRDEELPARARVEVERLNMGAPIRIDLGGGAPLRAPPTSAPAAPTTSPPVLTRTSWSVWASAATSWRSSTRRVGGTRSV